MAISEIQSSILEWWKCSCIQILLIDILETRCYLFCNSSGVFVVDLIEWLSIGNWFGSYTEVLQDWIWPALLLPPLLSKNPFKPVRRSRVGHLMISEHLQQCMLGDLCICQPCVLERTPRLLDHLTLRFIVSFFTEWHVFYLSRMHTSWPTIWHYRPLDQWRSRSVRANWRGLYGIADRSRSVRVN